MEITPKDITKAINLVLEGLESEPVIEEEITSKENALMELRNRFTDEEILNKIVDVSNEESFISMAKYLLGRGS